MIKPLFAGILTVACLAFSAGSLAHDMTKIEYRDVENHIEAEYKSAREYCGSLADDAVDVCMAEARGRNKVAKAELVARNKPSKRAEYAVSAAKAEAEYAVANKRCGDMAGTLKEVCSKEARSALNRAKAIARAQMKTSRQSAIFYDESYSALIKMYYGD